MGCSMLNIVCKDNKQQCVYEGYECNHNSSSTALTKDVTIVWPKEAQDDNQGLWYCKLKSCTALATRGCKHHVQIHLKSLQDNKSNFNFDSASQSFNTVIDSPEKLVYKSIFVTADRLTCNNDPLVVQKTNTITQTKITNINYHFLFQDQDETYQWILTGT